MLKLMRIVRVMYSRLYENYTSLFGVEKRVISCFLYWHFGFWPLLETLYVANRLCAAFPCRFSCWQDTLLTYLRAVLEATAFMSIIWYFFLYPHGLHVRLAKIKAYNLSARSIFIPLLSGLSWRALYLSSFCSVYKPCSIGFATGGQGRTFFLWGGCMMVTITFMFSTLICDLLSVYQALQMCRWRFLEWNITKYWPC